MTSFNHIRTHAKSSREARRQLCWRCLWTSCADLKNLLIRMPPETFESKIQWKIRKLSKNWETHDYFCSQKTGKHTTLSAKNVYKCPTTAVQQKNYLHLENNPQYFIRTLQNTIQSLIPNLIAKESTAKCGGYSLELTLKKIVSCWLNCLPIKSNNFILIKSEVRDSNAPRYAWKTRHLPVISPCGKNVSILHASTRKYLSLCGTRALEIILKSWWMFDFC